MKKQIQITTILFLTLIILTLCHIRVASAFSRIHFKPDTEVLLDNWTLPYVSMPNHSLKQIEIMNYAWEISKDKEFLYMLKAEMGSIDPNGQSNVYRNGIREDSWGLCQFHSPSNPEVVNDPKFFTDWKWQLDRCHEHWVKYQWKFNAYKRIQRDPSYRKQIAYHFKFNEPRTN